MNDSLKKATHYLPGFSRTGDAFLGVGLFSAIYFFGIAPLDPDLHHDGVQFAAAAGVADGLHIQSQVFEQYGPVTAWVQGLTLKVFGANLLNLRLENALFFTAISLITLNLLLKLRIPHLASVLICAAWVISCPVTSIPRISYGYAFWPWPSAISTLLLLAISTFFINSFVDKRPLRDWEINFVGALSAILTFTRIQVGAISLMGSVAILLLITMGATRIERLHKVLRFLAAVTATSSIFICVLWLQGSLSAFIGQVVTGSLDRYGVRFNWNFYKDYYAFGSAPLVILILLSVLAWKRLVGWRRNVVQISLGVFFLLALYIGNVRSPLFTRNSRSAFFLFNQLPFTFIYGATILTLVGLGAVIVVRSEKLLESKKAFYLLLALSLIPFAAQFYPMADQIHLWWVAPFFLVVFAALLLDLLGRRGITATISSLLVPLILISSYSFTEFKAIPRSLVFNQANAFKGMKVQDRYLPSYAGIGALLATAQPQETKFDCRDGLFSAWSGHYLAHDAKYVSWAWKTQSVETSTPPLQMFICSTPELARAFAQSNGYELVEPGVKYEFGLYSSGTMFEYRALAK